MKFDPTSKLMEQAEAVVLLKEQLKTLGLIEDDEAVEVSVESETTFTEIMEDLIKRDGELEAEIKGLDEYIKTMQARLKRLKTTRDSGRTLMVIGMTKAEWEGPLRTPVGTVSLKDVAEKVIVTDEVSIPSAFFDPPKPQDPVVNEQRLREHLMKRKEEIEKIEAMFAGEEDNAEAKANALALLDEEIAPIEGAILSDPGFTIAIRRK